MKVEELKNYGKGFVDTMSAPEMTKPVRKWIRRELRRELGLINLIKLMWRTRNKVKQMKTRDWSSLREHGLTDQKFLDMLIQNFTFMKVLADMVGMEKASEVLCRASDQMVYDAMSSISPSSEELNACGDAFESFKEYTKVSFPANERAGLLEIDVVEDTNNVFSYAVKYCAWHEVAKAFGDPYLCYPVYCYSDEVYYPRFCAQVGLQFKRTGTLATGAPVCDFTFERLDSGGGE